MMCWFVLGEAIVVVAGILKTTRFWDGSGDSHFQVSKTLLLSDCQSQKKVPLKQKKCSQKCHSNVEQLVVGSLLVHGSGPFGWLHDSDLRPIPTCRKNTQI